MTQGTASTPSCSPTSMSRGQVVVDLSSPTVSAADDSTPWLACRHRVRRASRIRHGSRPTSRNGSPTTPDRDPEGREAARPAGSGARWHRARAERSRGRDHRTWPSRPSSCLRATNVVEKSSRPCGRVASRHPVVGETVSFRRRGCRRAATAPQPGPRCRPLRGARPRLRPARGVRARPAAASTRFSSRRPRSSPTCRRTCSTRATAALPARPRARMRRRGAPRRDVRRRARSTPPRTARCCTPRCARRAARGAVRRRGARACSTRCSPMPRRCARADASAIAPRRQHRHRRQRPRARRWRCRRSTPFAASGPALPLRLQRRRPRHRRRCCARAARRPRRCSSSPARPSRRRRRWPTRAPRKRLVRRPAAARDIARALRRRDDQRRGGGALRHHDAPSASGTGSAAAIRCGRRSACRSRSPSAPSASASCSPARTRWTSTSRTAPLERNLPVLLGLLDVWYRNFHGFTSRSVAPYHQGAASACRPTCSSSRWRATASASTARARRCRSRPARCVWGEPGTNGQHAYFQMLHQGTDVIPVEFILVGRPTRRRRHARAADALAQPAPMLLANGLAQAQALMQRHARDDGRAAPQTSPATGRARPSLLERLTPRSLGALIALYEHRVFTSGALWGINSFDQWGVELGKALADARASRCRGAASTPRRATRAPAALRGLRPGDRPASACGDRCRRTALAHGAAQCRPRSASTCCAPTGSSNDAPLAPVPQVRAADHHAGRQHAGRQRRDQHLLLLARDRGAPGRAAGREGAERRLPDRAVHRSTSSTSSAGPRCRAPTADGDALEQRRIEYLKLQRQAPAITEVVWIDPHGREQLRISRLAMDAISSGTDLSQGARVPRRPRRAASITGRSTSARAPSRT